jgi:type I restriction enzyme S subunit
VNRVRLRHVVRINPGAPLFDRLTLEDELTFLPMEAIWADARLDLSRVRPKAAVATGYTRFQEGDVLVPKITPTFEAGRSVLVDGLRNRAGAGTTELHVLRPGGSIDPRFLTYVTQSHPFLKLGEAEMYGVAGQKRVPDDFIRDFVVDLPELSEQRRIADFLDAEIRRLIYLTEMRRAQVSLIRQREFAAISETLTGAATVGPRHPTGWGWLPDLPADWLIGPVYAYFDVLLGKMLNPERASGRHPRPYLRNANVHWYRIGTDDLAEMSFEPNERVRFRVKAGDLLVCEGGAGVGEAAVWDGRVAECYYQKSLHRVRARQSVPVQWLMYWLRLAKEVGLFASEGNVATIPHLTGEQLRECRIPIPPDGPRRVAELDLEIAEINRLVDAMNSADSLMAERRQALITAAVTGQIDVTTARGVD